MYLPMGKLSKQSKIILKKKWMFTQQQGANYI